jgi:r-opsin
MIPPLFGWNRFILEGFGTSCTFDYVSKDLGDRLFILILVIGGFFVPLSIILLSYGFILLKLSERTRRFASTSNVENGLNQQASNHDFNQLNILNETRPRSGTGSILDGGDDHNISQNIRRTESRATRTALLICAVFCSAWGPYALMTLISLSGFDYLVNAYTTAMLGLLTKLAACINPLIYALSLNGFREQICSYVKCICQCDRSYRHHLIPLDLNRKTLLNVADTTMSTRHH